MFPDSRSSHGLITVEEETATLYAYDPSVSLYTGVHRLDHGNIYSSFDADGSPRLDVPIVTYRNQPVYFSTTAIALSYFRRIGFMPLANESEEERSTRVNSLPDSEGWQLYDQDRPAPKEEFCDLHRVGEGYDAVYISPTGGWANVRTWDKFFVEQLAFPELPSQVLTRRWLKPNFESEPPRHDIRLNVTTATPTHEVVRRYLMVLFQCKNVSIVKALSSDKLNANITAL